ncbi:MAG TPA: hypothetical protein VGG38_00355 [Acidimicrobiales bacterium]|jgi:nucleotidyltransferase/DNA polymerase involved in DNA repair
MEMERLVVVWCPELLEEGARGEEARRFVQVVARAGELCPWVHPIRLGVCALPARGPARFFGGEAMVVSHLGQAVGEDAHIGVADGLFAAILAARGQLIVPATQSAAFLAPCSVAVLGRPDLAVTLQRLGITTLGQFAELPPHSVSDRFGADAAACHRVARGESGEMAGVRDRTIERRLRVARGEDPEDEPPPFQPGFFGGASAADTRAARSFVRVQERLGIEAVLVGRVQGGRHPAEQATLVPWGSPDSGVAALVSAPWPGRVPPPAPTQVLSPPRRAELVDAADQPLMVSGRGLLDRPLDRLSIDGGRWQDVMGWAGPWPVNERWWSGRRRRRARLQVVTVDGVARLLCTERGQWWVEAVYD